MRALDVGRARAGEGGATPRRQRGGAGAGRGAPGAGGVAPPSPATPALRISSRPRAATIAAPIHAGELRVAGPAARAGDGATDGATRAGRALAPHATPGKRSELAVVERQHLCNQACRRCAGR